MNQVYAQYYNIINQSQLLDDTPQAQLIFNVSSKLINAVEDYLLKIGRIDYTENYYDWEFHLVSSNTVNAFCMPGGKIVVYSGILSIANNEEKIAFILGHEMAHALLDHSRTQASNYKAKNTLTTVTRVGSLALDFAGLGGLGDITRAAVNVADIGSEFLLMKPFGRSQELEADKLGMMIIYLAGYNIRNIPLFWQDMSKQNSNAHDFFSTHPSDQKRIDAMKEIILEIDNHKDFYSTPILEDSLNSKNYINSKNNSINQQNYMPQIMDEFNPNNSVNKIDNQVYCQNCGQPVDIDAHFCTKCGHKLNALLKCPNCGTIINNEDLFCSNCGYSLK
ncbi:M48 family metallopeptidase [Methanobrevibacter acididurans]|uniref:M48 family metallopeptidase n=1 Tax=Methanobrevibacter acididurans TaxID=120963 RepID=UPI0038FCC932